MSYLVPGITYDRYYTYILVMYEKIWNLQVEILSFAVLSRDNVTLRAFMHATPCHTQLCTNTLAGYPRSVHECRWVAASPIYQWIRCCCTRCCVHPLLGLLLLHLVQRLLQLLRLLPLLHIIRFSRRAAPDPGKEAKPRSSSSPSMCQM